MINSITAYPKIVRARLFKSNESIRDVSAQNAYIPVILFVSTVFFYVVYEVALQPGWVLGGEMWAEMANNYFLNAQSPSYFQKLFATDSGYIPVPQRLIALTVNLFNPSAAAIPYFYTGSAIIFTGMLAGAFCLAPFRSLVTSDALRFFTALAILMVADFETRTFINFTYFAVFFVAVIIALALVDDSKELPWWAWFIPVLMVSKPAVLATLPAMIVVAMVSKPRFRRITIAAIVLCIGQLLQMVINQNAGVMPFQAPEVTFISKVNSTIKYFFGFSGAYLLGPRSYPHLYYSIPIGLCAFIFSGFVVLKKRNNSGALVFVGFSLLFFNVLLNSFALSSLWNENMAQLANFPLFRHSIVGFFGCVLVIVGLVANLSFTRFSRSPVTINLGALFFIVWFVVSGWLTFGVIISKEPVFPVINNSQWQKMAPAIDSGTSPLCVPVNPLGWIYSKNCAIGNPELNWIKGYRFEAVRSMDDSGIFEVTPPVALSERTLVSLAVLVKPATTKKFINVKAILNLKDRSDGLFTGEQNLAVSGGLILLTGKDSFPIRNIASVKFTFSAPVEIAIATNDPKDAPGILWMGN